LSEGTMLPRGFMDRGIAEWTEISFRSIY